MEDVNMKLNLMESNFNSTLDPVIDTVNQHTAAKTELESIADTSAETTKRILSDTKRLTDLLNKVTERCIDLEGCQKRLNIRIVGVKEGKEGNKNLRDFAADLLQKVLNLENKPLLGQAHRALRPRPSANAPPRQLILKVQYDHILDGIMTKIAGNRNLSFEGDRISIFRDNPVEVVKRRALFNETRGILKKIPNLRYGLMYPAKLSHLQAEGTCLHRLQESTGVRPGY